MEKLSILLLEDDSAICTAINEYVNKFDDISLVSITNNAQKAIEDIKNLLPHAVILDLELHNGRGSGLDVIRELSNTNLKPHPYILVTTNNTSKITYEYVRQYGADYIISKHQEDYTDTLPIDFLYQMKKIILNDTPLMALYQKEETPQERRKHIMRRIIVELNQIGITPKNIGYQYLLDAIASIIEEPTKKIFPVLCQKYNKPEKVIMRAMQNSIQHAWKATNFDDLFRNYTASISSENGIPTVSEFMYYYANKIGHESFISYKE